MFLVVNKLYFSEWLQKEMLKRGLNQSELAKLAGLNRNIINKVINQVSWPTPETIKAIAKGLKLPEAVVFQAAGLLPPAVEGGEDEENLKYLFSRLTPEDRREILELMRFKVERSSRGK